MKPIAFVLFGMIAMISHSDALADAAANNTSSSVSSADIDKVCAAIVCRKGGFDVVVRINKKIYTTIPVNPSPYVLENGSILAYPGETFAVQFTIENNKLGSPKFYKRFAPEMPADIVKNDKTFSNPDDNALPKLTDLNGVSDLPENALLISYGQSVESPGMIMVLKSTLPSTLKVDAIMALFGKSTYDRRPTSTCAVMAGKGSYEFWPDALGPMELTNARLLTDRAPMVCN